MTEYDEANVGLFQELLLQIIEEFVKIRAIKNQPRARAREMYFSIGQSMVNMHWRLLLFAFMTIIQVRFFSRTGES